ncbi:phosphotransferase family protein [Micropruina sp.]|uniref:phosphotransferase family protein n=1 Tax=Micropruina sp. TaxID=2737536 RepID=UPI0039E426D6
MLYALRTVYMPADSRNVDDGLARDPVVFQPRLCDEETAQPPLGTLSSRTTDWVTQSCAPSGARISAVRRLHGGTTAPVDLITLAGPNGWSRRVVLRRWERHSPATEERVEREVAALWVANSARLATPHLIASDACALVADTPSLVMSYIPGSVLLHPRFHVNWLAAAAQIQVAIHALPAGALNPVTSWFDPQGAYDWIADPGLRSEALGAAQSVREDRVFAHGDFHQFNMLWRGETISGIIDWTRAGAGVRSVDVGHFMLNLAALYSTEWAKEYVDEYERRAEQRLDAAGILASLLCWQPGWQHFSVPSVYRRSIAINPKAMHARVMGLIRTIARQRL